VPVDVRRAGGLEGCSPHPGRPCEWAYRDLVHAYSMPVTAPPRSRRCVPKACTGSPWCGPPPPHSRPGHPIRARLSLACTASVAT
jgi:hypothetical protein